MAIMILAISLFVNICLVILNQWMIKAWEIDVTEKIELCRQIDRSWNEKYEKLLEDYGKLYEEMGDDLK